MKLSMKCSTEDQTRVEESTCRGKSVDKPLVGYIYMSCYMVLDRKTPDKESTPRHLNTFCSSVFSSELKSSRF